MSPQFFVSICWMFLLACLVLVFWLTKLVSELDDRVHRHEKRLNHLDWKTGVHSAGATE